MITSISHLLHRVFKKFFGEKFSKEGFLAYSRNVQWVTISKILTMVFSLVTTMIVARILGPESFGVLNYVLSIIGLFSIIASLGVSNVTYKEMVSHKEKREEILGSSIALTMSTGAIAICLVFISLFFMHESTYIKGLILLMSLSFITQPLSLLSIDFLKDGESKYATITQLITSLVSSTLKILVVFLSSSLVPFIAILVIENLIAGCIYVYQIKKIKKRSFLLTVSKKQVLFILSSSIPLMLMIGFTEIYARIDQIMLKHYLDVRAVGLYSAAVRLTEVWYFIPNILITALFPALVNASKESPQEYKKRFNYLILILIITSLVISIITFVWSDLLITIVYGKDFIQGSKLLAVYVFSLLGSFVSMVLLQDLFLKNKKWLIILLPASTAALNITLNIYLIPLKSALGAAIATVISYNLVPVLYYIFKSKLKNDVLIK